ncbi:MAG: cysteine desulfurase family protein [Tissierellia bacterium]|nr:cysteine desulfurase family protein [Tissierellia bacterium]
MKNGQRRVFRRLNRKREDEMIYLDNAATTKVKDEVVDAMVEMLTKYYGNPSSVYDFAMESKKRMEEARKIIGRGLNVDPEEIYFTSCGSESNNLAILGSITGNQRDEYLFTDMEHSSVKKAYEILGKDKKIQIIHGDEGVLDPSKVIDGVNENTRLVSVMHVNNELGNIQDIETIGRGIKGKNPKTLFHVDGIQGFGKIFLDIERAKVDFYTMSAHKIHGPKGVGALYMRKGLELNPRIVGGGQEKAMSSGTENTAGIVGFGVAAKKALENREENYKKVQYLKDEMIKALMEIPHIHILSHKNSSPYILSVAIKDIKGEVLLHYLEDQKIYISTGSACHKGRKSEITKALGLEDGYGEGVIRISFHGGQDISVVHEFMKVAKPSIEEIRQIMGGIHG